MRSANAKVCGSGIFRPAGSCCTRGLTPPTPSLRHNKIGDTGAMKVAEALKVNSALTKLLYVAGAQPMLRGVVAAWGRGLTTAGMQPVPSLDANAVETEGAAALAKALKFNAAVMELQCVHRLPPSRFSLHWLADLYYAALLACYEDATTWSRSGTSCASGSRCWLDTPSSPP